MTETNALSREDAYCICLSALHNNDAAEKMKPLWKEIASSNRLYRGMKGCDALSHFYLKELEQKGLIPRPEEDESYLRSLYLVRMGLDDAYEEEMFWFPTVKNRCSFYLCRSRLHHRYGHLLLKTNRLYAANDELQMARDDLYRAMNCILDDYMGTESMIPHLPPGDMDCQGQRNFHQIAFNRKSRLVLKSLDRLLPDIERDIDVCVDELMEVIPENYRGQLSGYHHKMVTELLNQAKEYDSSKDRIEFLEKMKNRIEISYPEVSEIHHIRYYAYMPIEPISDMVPYVYWSVQNNLVLKYSDPIIRAMDPPGCRDELLYNNDRQDWLNGLFSDIIDTFGHARYLIYKYSIIRRETGDLRFPEPDKRGFYERIDGSFTPESETLTIKTRNILDKDFAIAGAVNVEYKKREHEELLIDAFIRLYSILDKISNLVQRQFSIFLRNRFNPERPSRPSIDGIAHYLRDMDEENPFLRVLETIYIEINPTFSENKEDRSKDSTYYARLPYAQNLYNLRNHIVHSELVLTDDREDLNTKSGIIFRRDFLERTKMLAKIVKEAIMTTMLAIEFQNKDTDRVLNKGI